MSQNESVQRGIFPRGDKNDAYAPFFTGQSYLHKLVADADIPLSVANVTFEPGCRNHWHIHTDGYQILLVTAGAGWYQEAGEAARALHPGDVVVTHKGIRHWHGAQKDSWFSHVAITAGQTEFFEPVDARAYDALH